jgi:hypothetical protein
VHADRIHDGGEAGIVGEAHAPVAVAAERLGREKGGAADLREGAGPAPVQLRAEGLGRVLDDEEPGGEGGAVDGAVVGRQPEEVDGDHPGRPELLPAAAREGVPGGVAFFDGGDRLCEQAGVQVEGRRVDVDEDRGRPEQLDHLGRGDEGEGGGEDGIAALDPVGHQGEQQGVGPGGTGDGMPDACEIGQLLFELLYLRAHDVLAVVEDGQDVLLELGSYPLLLKGQVDELQRVPPGEGRFEVEE